MPSVRFARFVLVACVLFGVAGCPGPEAVPPEQDAGSLDAPGADVPRADAPAVDVRPPDAPVGVDAPSSCIDPDVDGDGADSMGCGGTDCDDADADRAPGLPEVCDGTDLDEDCDATTFGDRDLDGDGFTDSACCNGSVCGPDCNDVASGVSPDAPEVCNDIDEDCDGSVDEGATQPLYPDADGDGFGARGSTATPGCLRAGFALLATDCDDTTATANPATTEVCSDGIDNNCDGRIDETGPRLFFRDADGDGFGDPGDSMMTALCTPPSGYVGNSSDCDDLRAGSYPANPVELCDGLDNDCNLGLPGGGVDRMEDSDGDLHASSGAACVGGPYPRDDCNDAILAIHPGAVESCDGLDDDCSSGGGALPAEDFDGDMSAPLGAACTGGFPNNDCNDLNPAIHLFALEVCDGLDDDCSSGGGPVPAEDLDGDRHTAPTPLCAGGPYPEDDCNDTNADVYLGAPEICDRFDDDCSSGGGALAAEDADADMHAPSGAACTGGFARDDCQDGNVNIYAGAPELCDALDDDCSSGGGALPAEDVDGDLHSAPGATCAGGFARDDCQDGNAAIYPGAPELCDVLDDDCSSGGTALPAEDADGDLHSALGAACTGGYPRDDCDDTNAAVYPGIPLLPPRLLAPENGALTGSRFGAARGTLRPTFQWTEDLRTCGTFEIQVDDSCSTASFATCSFPSPITASGLTGSTHRFAADLPVSAGTPGGSRYYWRMRTCDGATCGAYGPVRYLDVGRAPNDFNGDGYSDVAAGAHGQDVGVMSGLGYVFTYAGASGGVSAIPWTVHRDPYDTPGDGFGQFVASAGDVNADGFADLIVGAPSTNWSTVDDGVAYVFYGSVGGLPPAPSRELVNPPPHEASGLFGVSVAGAGDVNADGYADVIVGGCFIDAGAVNEGNVLVYHGSATGIPAAPARTLDNPANQVNGVFGRSVASAGDVNGDGYSDIVVGAEAQDAGAADEGNAFIFHGSATGLPAGPSRTLDNPANQAIGHFGRGVAGAGDLNGDGYGDVVIGALGQDAGATDEGNAFVYYGSALGIPVTPSRTLDSPANEVDSEFGATVASAGDVNGDGFMDLVVGAPLSDYLGFVDTGYVYFYQGSATGITTTPTVSIRPVARGNFGDGLASAGDVNGDGFADLVIGAPLDDTAANDAGAIHIYQGSATGIDGSAPTRTILESSQPGAYFGNSVARADPARRGPGPRQLADWLALEPAITPGRRREWA